LGDAKGLHAFDVVRQDLVEVGSLLTVTATDIERGDNTSGAVGELVGIDGGVVSGVINLESSGVEASDWRPRHDERYHEA
jgi:high-affinity K+ transport system ATPase subunit B